MSNFINVNGRQVPQLLCQDCKWHIVKIDINLHLNHTRKILFVMPLPWVHTRFLGNSSLCRMSMRQISNSSSQYLNKHPERTQEAGFNF